MNEEEIFKVAKIIEEWNPLGEAANSTEQLEGYRYEAIDIIASSNILSGSQSIKESIKKVLTQAFNINLNATKLTEAAKQIELILANNK